METLNYLCQTKYVREKLKLDKTSTLKQKQNIDISKTQGLKL